MIAIDTNVLVRLLVADDPAQSSRARALLETQDVWIGPTVLLEAAWVLDAAEPGMDVADAFHVALASPEAEAFATFDRNVVRLVRPHSRYGASNPSDTSQSRAAATASCARASGTTGLHSWKNLPDTPASAGAVAT